MKSPLRTRLVSSFPRPGWRSIVLSLGALLLVGLSVPFLDVGIDWHTHLRPATLAFLHLRNPYAVPGTFNPPWVFPLLAPLALLPPRLGGALLFWLALATWVFVTHRITQGNRAAIVAVVLSPLVINGLLARNVDFLALWGLFLPPPWAVLFFTIKPQVGGAVLIPILWQAFRQGGWKQAGRVLWFPTLLTLLSVIAYGPWPLAARQALHLTWNASPWRILGWPSLLVGVALLRLALTRKSRLATWRIAMAASPFFSPYVGTQSWVAVLPALMNTPFLYVVWAGLWGWLAYLLWLK